MISQAEIPPGGEGEVKVTLHTNKRSGTLRKPIKITTDDPTNPITTVYVQAFIEVDLGFEPASARMGKVNSRDMVTESVYIVAKEIETLKITDIKTSTAFISAKEVPDDAPTGERQRLRLEITVKPGMPLGGFSETVTVSTNRKNQSVITLPVYGAIVNDVEASPASLRFLLAGESISSRTRTKRLYVINHQQDRPLSIVDVKDADNRLEFDVRVREKGQKYELTVTLKEDVYSKGESVQGTIVITTDCPRQKTVAVEYTAERP